MKFFMTPLNLLFTAVFLCFFTTSLSNSACLSKYGIKVCKPINKEKCYGYECFIQELTFTSTEKVSRFSENLDHQEPKTANVERFQEIIRIANARNLSFASMHDIMQTVAEQFIGARYQANLLDKFKQEKIFISFEKFDCVIFVETVLALARNIALQEERYQNFVDRVVEQRYLNGQRNSYCSRLHYFSGWINENQKRGIVKDITISLGGVTLNKKLDFMSTHRWNYPHLRNNHYNYECILQVEADLSKLQMAYIPKNKISKVYGRLQRGDIIGIVTDVPGLDITHTGLIHISKEKIGLIHASSTKRKVIISSDLQKFVYNMKHAIGIVVARPHDPLGL